MAAAVLLVATGGTAGFFGSRHYFLAPGPLPAPRNLVVPHGTPAELGLALQHDGMTGDPRLFRAAALLTRGEGPLRAGEFAFPAHASLQQVLAILRFAHPVQHRLTIPEGLTAAQIALLVDRVETLTGDTPLPDEGSTLPQSYAFERGMPRVAVIDRARAAMQHTLDKVWAERSPGLPLASPEELVTLASIVERETARPEERPHVAAVFINRLRAGMRLQSDPTVAYAASGGMGALDHGITRAELDNPNPYNTYRITGLPPGPIASPGLAALQATAHPLASDDLYFVADGTGGHAFSRTLEEHNRNVKEGKAKTGALPSDPKTQRPL